MKLHLGCGNKHIDGYINIDIRYLPGVDKVDNVKSLRRFDDNSVEVIYACHVLEHQSRWDSKLILKRWFDILQSNGILRIAVPDFERIVDYYKQYNDLDMLMGLLYGGQDYDNDIHKCCWDFNRLSTILKEIGFVNIKRYSWRQTEHSNIDDFSQAYIPHMDKENGMLMSLNIEAIKP